MNTYSILNHYSYSEKTNYFKGVDFFSAPLRIALGGKSINIDNASFREYGIKQRVQLAIVSIVIFPVGIISAIAFTAKVLSNESLIVGLVEKIKMNFPHHRPQLVSFYSSATVKEINKSDTVSPGYVKIAIRDIYGKELIFSVKDGSKLEDLEAAITARWGIDKIRLMFAGKQLNLDLCLNDYNISEQNKGVTMFDIHLLQYSY